MQLHEALEQITAIRSQMARAETFRGYRALTVAFAGAVGVAAAIIQSRRIPDPANQVWAYLALWITAAAVNLAVLSVELAVRCLRSLSPLATRMTCLAVEQFLPSIAAGLLVTGAVVRGAPENLWILPGLWSVLFGLGIFASCRLLPRSTFWVGVFYLFAGTTALAAGPGGYALSPWFMGVTFGGGHMATAGILYWALERNGE